MTLLEFETFMEWTLTTICDFILTPPILYIFGFVCTCWVIKIFKMIVGL